MRAINISGHGMGKKREKPSTPRGNNVDSIKLWNGYSTKQTNGLAASYPSRWIGREDVRFPDDGNWRSFERRCRRLERAARSAARSEAPVFGGGNDDWRRLFPDVKRRSLKITRKPEGRNKDLNTLVG